MNVQQINQLKILSDKLHMVYASALPGEEWHKGYKKDPKLFKVITTADIKLEKAMRMHFRALAEKASVAFDVVAYSQKLKKASTADDFIKIDWNNDTLEIQLILTNELKNVVLAGGLSAEAEAGSSVGLSSGDDFIYNFLRTYSKDLAGGLTQTTQDRIRESLLTSISLNEDATDAANRMGDVIDDPKRAATIAHTETVRAYNAGRVGVGKQMGADKKQWSTTLRACPICTPLESVIVGIDEDFETGFGNVQYPPIHPHCRCLVFTIFAKQ